VLTAVIAAGLLGDVYLIWGHSSGTAFALPALGVPLLVAASLTWVIVAAVGALRPVEARTSVLCGGCAVILGALVVLNLVPPVARDELTHHLAIPALYVRAGRLIEVPFADQSYYPMLLEMFYTPLLRWLPDNSSKYLHLLYGVATAGVIGLYVRRQHDAQAAALAGLLVLSTPVVFALGASAYVDLGLLFYATAALVALLIWAEQPRMKWLVLSALLAGLAASTKYNGFLVVILLGAGTVLLPGTEHGNRERLRFAATFAVVALLPVAPWILKNLLETGNPVFPLFNAQLGGQPLPDRGSGIDVLTWRRRHYGESWLDIALIPLRIFLTGREGDPARFDGVFSPLLLLGFVAPLRRNASRAQRLMAVYAAAYAGLAFFLTVLRVRYSIVIIGPLVLLTVDELVKLRRADRLQATLATLAVGGALLFSTAHFAELWLRWDPLPFVTGRTDRDTYIAQFVPEYEVLRHANRELPDTARLYLLFLGNRSYYCQRDYVYDFGGKPVRLRDSITASMDGAGIAARLRASGISNLLSHDRSLSTYLLDREQIDDAAFGRWLDFAGNHLRLVRRHNGFGLYELREP
jgi:hypothetical protein